MIEAPFTFVHWVMIEQFSERCNNPSAEETEDWLNSLNFPPNVARILSLNILPQCWSILHLTTGSRAIVEFICNKTQEGLKDENEDQKKQGGEEQDEKYAFPIPFNSDINGKSPLHMSLFNDGNDEDDSSGIFDSIRQWFGKGNDQKNDSGARSSQNERTTEYFLGELLQKMPMDHHGRAIVDVLPECIRKEIPKLSEYLDSRFKTSTQLEKMKSIQKYRLKEDNDSKETGNYIDCIDLWPDQQKLQDKVLEESSSGVNIDAKILDLPGIVNPESDAG